MAVVVPSLLPRSRTALSRTSSANVRRMLWDATSAGGAPAPSPPACFLPPRVQHHQRLQPQSEQQRPEQSQQQQRQRQRRPQPGLINANGTAMRPGRASNPPAPSFAYASSARWWAATTTTTTTTTSVVPSGPARWMSTSPSPDAAAAANNDGAASLLPPSSPKLKGLHDEIIRLPEEEVNVLGELVLQMLGRTIFPGEFGGGGGGGAGSAGGSEEAAAAVEVVEAKTIFDLRLVGFDAKAKIKVIKEVRAIAGLGLKEAKELVEASPKVVQKGLKQDKAEELKALLEAAGAVVEIV